jgi:sporadic carbohydrate cluster protein (TIGR04323 family)
LKKLLTYTLPRTFNKYNIPIAIQSNYLKDYAKNNHFEFSLPVTEIKTKNIYIQLKKITSKKPINIAMVSIFILPVEDLKLLKSIMYGINVNTKFHFALEKLVLNKSEIKNWAYEYVKYKRVINLF